MEFQDSRSLPISTRSSKAAQHYRDGADLLLSAWPGTVETLARATEADPAFALAEAALARAFAVRAQPHEAKRHIEKAAGLVEAQGTDREKSHVATLALAIGGQSAKALDSALAHTDRWPRDTVGKVAAKRGVKTLALTHHRPRADGAMLEVLAEEVAKDFSGRIVIGQDLTEIDV